jgi:hypothetical protein
MTLQDPFAPHVNIIHQTYSPDGQDQLTFEGSYCLLSLGFNFPRLYIGIPHALFYNMLTTMLIFG